MIKVKDYINNNWVYITLQELCNRYDEEAPIGWFQYIKEEIDDAMNIKTQEEYYAFLENHKHLALRRKKFDFKELRRFYNVLNNSKYSKILDDDILKYISFIRECSFFDIVNYKLDENSPDLDDWLNSKNPFKFNYTKEELDNAYSMMDLLPLKYGMNAIRGQLLKANKKIY